MEITEDNNRAFLDDHELQRMGRILKGANTEGHLEKREAQVKWTHKRLFEQIIRFPRRVG